MNGVSEIGQNEFTREVVEAKDAVLVDFYAPWCGPCRMMAPVLEKLAAEYRGRLRVAKVNVDEAPDLAAQHDIRGVPTLMLFVNGEPVRTWVGFQHPQTLKQHLEALLPQAAARP